MNLADLRKDYSKAGLHRADLAPDPVVQFRSWLADAVKGELPEPNAMTLCTVDTHGDPDGRIVLLKGLDERGFHFYTNQQSVKAADLEGRPKATLVFFWLELERQVRVRGDVSRLTRADTEAYFKTRPRGNQLGAWVSAQSTVIHDHATLERQLEEIEARFPGGEIPPPPHWGGYAVQPVSVEFWQGRPSRLHDRFRYTREPEGWRIDRLAP